MASVVCLVESPYPPVNTRNTRLFYLSGVLRSHGVNAELLSPKQYGGVMIQPYGLEYVGRLLNLLLAAKALVSKVRREGVYVVHAWNLMNGIAATIAKKLTGVRFHYDMTDITFELIDAPFTSSLMRLFEPIVWRSADVIVASSQYMKNVLKSVGVSESRIIVVPDGGDSTLFMPTPARRRGSSITLVYHGDVKTVDGVPVLLKALARLAGEPVRLLMVGDAPRAIMETAMKLGLLEKVTFTGWVPYTEVSKYLRSADVGIVPLLDTIYGNALTPVKLWEYLALGLPVIVSDVATVGPVIRNSGCGLLFKPGDDKMLADAILRFGKMSSKDRFEMGRKGRRLMEQNYEWRILMVKEAALCGCLTLTEQQ